MLSDTDFQSMARDTLAQLHDRLEDAYESGTIEDLDLVPGVLTITTDKGQSFVVSAHGPSQQIWLASPISGGLHFTWNGTAWALADGRALDALLMQELQVSV